MSEQQQPQPQQPQTKPERKYYEMSVEEFRDQYRVMGYSTSADIDIKLGPDGQIKQCSFVPMPLLSDASERAIVDEIIKTGRAKQKADMWRCDLCNWKFRLKDLEVWRKEHPGDQCPKCTSNLE